MNHRLDRRKFLTGAGSLMLLPMLESFYSVKALAAGTSDPRRLVMIHLPNGTYCRNDNKNWFAAPDSVPLTSANAPIPLQNFTANLADITILKYLTQSARDATLVKGGGQHGTAKACLFTGQVVGNLNASNCTISGDSFDVMYAKKTPQQRIVYLATCPQGNGDGFTYPYELSISNGANVVPEINPISFYNTYFAGLSASPSPSPSATPAPTADIARNPAILNTSFNAIKELQSKLGKGDQDRISAFLQGLTDLQKSFAAGGGGASAMSCSAPAKPNLNNANQAAPNGADYFQRMFAFNSLIALGFQCDLFRSISISLGAEAGSANFSSGYPSSLNYQGSSNYAPGILGDHLISHHMTDFSQSAGATGATGTYMNFTRDILHMYVITDLINKLKAVTDPSGSKVLDNTAIMAAFGVLDGEHGETLGQPAIAAGGRNFMTTGYSLNASNYDINDLYYTFSTYLGMGLQSVYPIAQTAYAFGPKTGRTAGTNLIKWTGA